MLSRHGSLESAILSTLWELESSGLTICSVKDVFENLKCEKRAYTTIKTVMDRLCIKGVLNKQKRGKKYYYKTAFSNREVIVKSLNDLTRKYCSGNLTQLCEIIDSMRQNRQALDA